MDPESRQRQAIVGFFVYSRQAKVAWVIKMTLLEEGLNILGRIGNNTQNLRLLVDCLDNLVPFVGAGLSSDFDYPSWNKLIEDLADTRPHPRSREGRHGTSAAQGYRPGARCAAATSEQPRGDRS
jgi:hypothetical protein